LVKENDKAAKAVPFLFLKAEYREKMKDKYKISCKMYDIKIQMYAV